MGRGGEDQVRVWFVYYRHYFFSTQPRHFRQLPLSSTDNVAEVDFSEESVHDLHAVAHPVVHQAPVLVHAVHLAPVHAAYHGLAPAG